MVMVRVSFVIREHTAVVVACERSCKWRMMKVVICKKLM